MPQTTQKPTRPLAVAPWRGGGKHTTVFQKPGGTGGGYSGGSNHGALMKSQSANNQFPNLVR